MRSRRGSPSVLSVPLLAAVFLAAGSLPSAVRAQEPSVPPSVVAPSIPSPAGSPAASVVPDPFAGIELLVRGERDPGLVVPEEDLAALVHGNTAFALELYQRLARGADNLVLGPLSISYAMAMNQVGARGTTATETGRAMHFDLPVDRLAAAYDRLDRDLEALAGPALTISLVDRLFGQQGYPFKEPFLETLSTRFGAPMAVVDYADPEAVRQLINRWVAGETADRIRTCCPPARSPRATRLVLVNATYLNADWATPFNAAFTEERPFRIASGRPCRYG